jgi:hypothetical protein
MRNRADFVVAYVICFAVHVFTFPLRCVLLHKCPYFSREDEILPLELSVELKRLTVKKGGQWYHIDRWVDGGMREGGKAGKKLLTGGVGYSNIGRVRSQA